MQPDHTIITWGNTLNAVLVILVPFAVKLALAGAALAYAWLGRHLPAAVVNGIRETLTDAKITRAVNYAFAVVEGVEKDKTLDAGKVGPVASAAIAYIEQMAPSLAQQLAERLGPMVLAKISSMVPVTSADVPHAALPSPPATAQFIKVPS